MFQAANSFKMGLYYCLVVKKRKKKEKNKSAILQTAVGLHWILLAEPDSLAETSIISSLYITIIWHRLQGRKKNTL